MGVWLMTGGTGKNLDWKKFLNPPMLATISSVILVLLGVSGHIPDAASRPVKMLGDCLLPLVMLVLGGNFALMDLKKMPVTDIGLVVLTKLFIYPIVMLGVLFVVPVKPLVGFLLVMEAAVPCANTLSVIGRHYRTPNQDFINQGLFFTNIASVLTIPLFLTLYVKLM